MPAVPSRCALDHGRSATPAHESASPARSDARQPSAWGVASVGYRIPSRAFDGRVHAVFTRACYVEQGESLLTVAVAGAGPGPMTLVLDADAAADLRGTFRRGDPVRCRGGLMRTRGTTLDLRRAEIWRTPPARPALAADTMGARIDVARERLAQARRTRQSVLEREAAVALGALVHACRDLDAAGAASPVARLVGWGEGLTPAGDDCLVGVCAALAALANGIAPRRAFVVRLQAMLDAGRARTTPIAAQCLALAASGDFGGDVLRVVDAVRAEPDESAAHRTIDAVLGVGATSGADLVTGVLAGFDAWNSAR
jgi:hypothetical protein